jgi:inosine-uridine nucleoside N-ribohydrolase
MTSTARPRVLIDCDPGHDDVIAIAVAAAHADIVGITTVGGNSTLTNTTRNALIATDIFELTHVPVHVGAATPISAIIQRHPTEAHGTTGLDGPVLPQPSRQATGNNAVDFIIESSRSHEGMWIVAIGPLTNIALALRQDPSIATRISGISIMGGSLKQGNSTATAEFNVWFDADAAAEVFDAAATNRALHLRMCGLDLTEQVAVDATFVDALANTPTRAARFCEELMTFYRAFSVRLAGLDADAQPDLAAAVKAPLFDPCAVLAVTHPELFVMNQRNVVVETEGRYTRGMTVADLRSWANPDHANVTVVERADPRCVNIILSALTNSTTTRE